MAPPPTSENIPQLSERDVARIVQCLRVVVKVVDAGVPAQKVTIAGILEQFPQLKKKKCHG
jgi:hypothetical protein